MAHVLYRRTGIHFAGTCARAASGDIERLGAGRLARGVDGDLLDARLGLAQQLLAAALERLAALVDRHGLLERHGALLEFLDDGLELCQRLLERQTLDVGIRLVGHDGLLFGGQPLLASGDQPRIRAVTWAATDRARPSRS